MEGQKGSNVSPSTSDGKQDKSSGKREHVYEPSNDGRDDSKKPKLGTNPKHSLSQGPIPAPKIAISLGSQKFAAPTVSSVKPTSSKLVAKAFNVSDDEEEEEMPAEARMRMKNIGRETPTSAGPNSFGKSKRGFTDYNSLFQKQLKEMAETEESATSPNSPTTSRDKSKK